MSTTIPSNPPVSRPMLDMLELCEGPAIVLSPDYYILAANEAYAQVYGDGAPVVGRRCYEVSHQYHVPCDRAGESCPLKLTSDTGEMQRVLHVHHTPRGEEHVDVQTRPIRESDGSIRFFVEVMRQTPLAAAEPSADGLVGRTPVFNRLVELIQRVAPSEAATLLLGETGTGKELVAHAIHEASGRRDGPFVPVECSGLTETLFESELFGHERGAFTGAQYRKRGLVEAARGGTLFLDEVGDIPMAIQVKLLRLLETGTFRRVGSVEPEQADFRLVCATHRDLKRMVAEGQFREDLYYRLSVFPIRLPPLRERREDIALLATTLLQRLEPTRRRRLDTEALTCLENYDFPGNVRELRNILERASVLAGGGTIRGEHLPEEVRCTDELSGLGAGELLQLEEVERRYLHQSLRQFNGDKKALARALGISERTLYRKLGKRSP